jgi:phage-related protein/predicted XRE-type DNA-binding protein
LNSFETPLAEREEPVSKPLVWLHGEIKTPPFTPEGRHEAGMLLRLLQAGERLGMPQAEPLPDVGPRCGALRVRDAGHNWRIVYRIDADVVLVLEVYSKTTRKIPGEVMSDASSGLNNMTRSSKPPRSKPGSEVRSMNATKRKALEAAGWKIGDAADFLEMSEEERQLLNARVELALAIRRQREAHHLSQKQLGARLKTSQPRMAKIERAAADVSMDQLIRAFTAAGGKIVVKSARTNTRKSQRSSDRSETVVLEVATSK